MTNKLSGWRRRVSWDEEQENRRPAQEFAQLYPDRQEALVPACEAMFQLNRYAKCYPEYYEAIYKLKGGMIHWLYKNGYCVEAYKHTLHYAPVICRECHGHGCWCCENTGEWTPERSYDFVVFRFVVDGRNYCWHAHAESVRFAVTLAKREQAEWEATPATTVVAGMHIPRLLALVGWFLGT